MTGCARCSHRCAILSSRSPAASIRPLCSRSRTTCLAIRVLALTTTSPTMPDDDRESALAMARLIGARHLLVESNELEITGYAANPLNRCYLCKHNLFTVCETKAGELGIDEIVDGLNLDDLHDYRPGMQAHRKARASSAGRSRDDQGRRARAVARDGIADLGSSRIAVPVVALSVRHRNNARRAQEGCGG